jgi:hypothetical protein
VAAIGWADVVGIASGLSSVSASAQQIILSLVNNELNAARLGGEASARLRLIRSHLAAHLGDLALKKGGSSGSAGPVSSETISEDEIRIDYAAAMAHDKGALSETVYGRQFLTLVRNSPARAPFAL